MNSTPSVAVIVSTRNRGDRIVPTIKSILSNDYPNFQIIVVDQSKDDATERALRPFLDNACVKYVRSAKEGLSASRNVGIENTQSELIAITDDDCVLPTCWLNQLVKAFSIDHRIGLVFGNVLPADHDATEGFVPSHVCEASSLARGIREKHKVQGVGACMSVRRSLWHKLGGFDPMLGVGSPLRAGEETDLTIRALLAGYFVYQTPDVALVHHGFYTWQNGKALIYGYWYGTGAAFGKNFKCHPWPMTYLLTGLAFRWLFVRSPVASSLGHQPHRWLRLKSFTTGFLDGVFVWTDQSHT